MDLITESNQTIWAKSFTLSPPAIYNSACATGNYTTSLFHFRFSITEGRIPHFTWMQKLSLTRTGDLPASGVQPDGALWLPVLLQPVSQCTTSSFPV